MIQLKNAMTLLKLSWLRQKRHISITGLKILSRKYLYAIIILLVWFIELTLRLDFWNHLQYNFKLVQPTQKRRMYEINRILTRLFLYYSFVAMWSHSITTFFLHNSTHKHMTFFAYVIWRLPGCPVLCRANIRLLS